MLTFEKVLEEFKDYLSQDEICEVVLTKRGYTVMFWDEPSKIWYGVEFCETPERLQEELTASQAGFERYNSTKERKWQK